MITLAFLSKSLAIVGLSLDIFGIYKLFNLEPKPLNEASDTIFDATIGDWSDIDKLKHISTEINDNISNLRLETNVLRKKSKKYFRLILIGFSLQFISVLLSFFL